MWRGAVESGTLAKRSAAGGLVADSVFRQYRGLDGDIWPELEHSSFEIEDGLADVEKSSMVDGYVDSLSCRDECDVIVLCRAGADVRRVEQLGWIAAGFDVGYLESAWSRFSVILNEVMFGMHEELRSFAARLNSSLLFAAHSDALELIAERRRLATLGKDLELEPPLVEPIMVCVRRSRVATVSGRVLAP